MIIVKELVKTIKNGAHEVEIIRDISFQVPARQFVAIMGPSGSGKSTLLGLIAGLDFPTSGTIQLDGIDITGLREDEMAVLRGRKLGFVFQSYHLIPTLTALENVMLPMELLGDERSECKPDRAQPLRNTRSECKPDAKRKRDSAQPQERAQQSRDEQDGAVSRAEYLLESVGLAERRDHYPVQLSGGEQQRVALARAFMMQPSILLADEPTGNLDSVNGQHVLELLLRLNREQGTTLLLVTHDQSLASHADRHILLRDGRIVEDRVL